MSSIRIAAAALLLASGAAPAHDMWLHAEPSSPAPGEPVTVHLYIGGDGTVEPVLFGPQRIEQLFVKTPSGTRALGLRGPAAQVRVETDAAGTYTVAYESSAAPSVMDATAFEAYLQEERLDAVLALHRAAAPHVGPVQEHFSRSLKTLVRAGDAPLVDCAVRLPLELSLVTSTRDTLLIRADFREEAVGGLWVERADAAGAVIEERQTDAEGLARFAAGAGEWILRATYMEAATEAGTDWRSWWATTSFEWNGEDPVLPCGVPREAKG